MIKNIELYIPIEYRDDLVFIKKSIARSAKISLEEISNIEIVKRSLDCRSKVPKYLFNINIYSGQDNLIEENYNNYKECDPNKVVHIVGAGPAGYFAALELMRNGIKPIIYERGKDVRNRRFDLKQIMQKGLINPNSNYCFGEGGAGTFSDGKLYTRSLKRGNVKKILKIFVENGADPDILVDSQAHIGSDKLPDIISEIRNTILKFGGEVHFNSKLTNLTIKNSIITEIEINNEQIIEIKNLILATGHSAKDIYYLLDKNNVKLESKDFAIGFRIEHYQEHINELQYGKKFAKILPPASYKFVSQVNDKGVYSFCMCPGGIIVPSSTSPKELVVNGMSMHSRNSKFANSGFVCSVNNADLVEYTQYKEFAGLKFQEDIESSFYFDIYENFMKAPAQRTIDFVNNKESNSLEKSSYIPGLINIRLDTLFPKLISESLRVGLININQKKKGFICNESNVIGLESRTSSPLRIPREKELMHHIQIKNLYPVGEGAGYSGGIVSSAIDGENAAKIINTKINNQ